MIRATLTLALLAAPALACNADEYAEAAAPVVIITVTSRVYDEAMRRPALRSASHLAASCADAWEDAIKANRVARSRGVDASIVGVNCVAQPGEVQ
jgi:hypothetical protein